MTEMMQIAAASIPPKKNLVRKGSCAWLLGLEKWKEGECLWGSRRFLRRLKSGPLQSSLEGVLPPRPN